MPRRYSKKPRHCHAHFKRRMVERYGIFVTKEDIRVIEGMIANNKATFLGRYSLTRSLWLVEFHDRTIPMVYNNRLHAVTTALTGDVRELRECDDADCVA